MGDDHVSVGGAAVFPHLHVARIELGFDEHDRDDSQIHSMNPIMAPTDP
jgi:hypothetical protein